ncbi:MAG: endonuclease/exonuclease/phosphatase family protein [Spirochaetota bacterium]
MCRGIGAALLVLVVITGGAVADEPSAELTVLSFNVRSARGEIGGEPRYDEANMAALLTLIEELRPGVVLLQELDRGVARTERVDQFESLRAATGMEGEFAGTTDYQGGRFGIAVLTRHEIVDTSHERLPRLGGKEPRALQHLKIRLENGWEVDLFNTHIDPRPVSRDRQIELVHEHTTRLASNAAVLAGDFNATPGSSAITRLTDAWTDAAAHAAAAAPTYPARTPSVRVDYVFFRRERLELRSFATLEARGISDHRPLFARFDVRP